MDSSSSEVKIISECFVQPKTLPEKWKEPYHITPFEHVMLSIHYIQKGLLFLKPSISESDNAVKPKEFMETLLQKLKDSLATTLVHFYPLAGRLSSTLETENPRSHSVFVDCNNSPGAGFIYAKSDLSVSDIVGSKYIPLVVQSFFDHHKALNIDGYTMSLVSVKVTELVDGMFIGLSMNHSIGDGSSFWQFFNSLSDIFNSSQEETIEYNNNNNNNNSSFLCLKNPPIFRQMSGPTYTLPFCQPHDFMSPPVMKERMFHFSSETVRSLKSKANQECGTTTISCFQSLAAFIWRSITKARKLLNDQETTCRFAAGNRSRMNPPLPTNYFGAYISFAQATTKTGHLLENEFELAALKLHQAVTEHTAEKISADMDRCFNSPSSLDDFFSSNIVHMGSSPRFNKYGCEFGMGKALAVRSGYGGKYDGKVSAYPGREGNGSIDLEVCLLPEFMEALESDQELMSLVSPSS